MSRTGCRPAPLSDGGDDGHRESASLMLGVARAAGGVRCAGAWAGRSGQRHTGAPRGWARWPGLPIPREVPVHWRRVDPTGGSRSAQCRRRVSGTGTRAGGSPGLADLLSAVSRRWPMVRPPAQAPGIDPGRPAGDRSSCCDASRTIRPACCVNDFRCRSTCGAVVSYPEPMDEGVTMRRQYTFRSGSTVWILAGLFSLHFAATRRRASTATVSPRVRPSCRRERVCRQ